MKKKILAAALSLGMVMALTAGCGTSSTKEASEAKSASAASTSSESTSASSEEASEKSTSSESTAELVNECDDNYLIEHLEEYCGTESTEGKKIGMTVQSLGNDFMIYLTDAIRAGYEEMGCEFQLDSCDGDSNTQVEQIENYITMGMDLIVVFPLNGDSVITVMEQAEKEGIPTIAFAMDVSSDKITCHQISAEEDTMGTAAGELASSWVDETFPDAKDGEVNVLVIGTTSSPEMDVRSSAMEEAITANSKCKVTRQDTADSNSTDEGRNTAENMFLGNSYDLVLTCNATTALGVDAYIKSSDSPISDLNKFAIYTVDETDEIDAKIASSTDNESCIRGTISMGSIDHTAQALMAASKPILTGGTPVTYVDGAAQPITPESLAEA